MSFNIVTILGPTATGKTKLAARLAHLFNGEIISADSRQVYKYMDIGTGKDLTDYFVDGTRIQFHLIDIVHPSEEYNLYRFKKDFSTAFNLILSKNKLPFLVGGTGMYLSAVVQQYRLKKADFDNEVVNELNSLSTEELTGMLHNYKTDFHNVTDLIERDRIIKALLVAKSVEEDKSLFPDVNPFVIGINPGRAAVKSRITERLKKRLNEGMIDEVKSLLEKNVSPERLIQLGLEYKFICMYLQGILSYNDMYQKLNSAIHEFAKKQMTWFRKMEREGVKIHWLEEPDAGTASELLRNSIS